MALHTKLPIYKDANGLLNAATDYVQNMPRSIKTVIGPHISKLCVELVLMIIRANCARDKIPYLDTLLERNEELQILFRLCRDKRFISDKQLAQAIEFTTSIGKQANGWKKHNAAQPPVT